MNILAEIRKRFAAVLNDLVGQFCEVNDLLNMVCKSQNPKFGDYQANFVMSLARRIGKPEQAQDLAADIVARLKIDDLCWPASVDGPGFINMRLKRKFVIGQLQAIVNDPRLGVPEVETRKTYVIDYSSPNVAKPMHIGHIRSTVIGDALTRVLRFLGHQVISDNHLGDWGTQFGMILFGYKHFLDVESFKTSPVNELARLYRKVWQRVGLCRLAGTILANGAFVSTIHSKDFQKKHRKTILAARDFEKSVFQETVKLHAGDESSLKLWGEFLPHCLQSLNKIYDRLNITFNQTLGESFYHDRLAGVVEDLIQRGIAKESDGAICIFQENKPPLIIRKKDGAFLYATTDLATIQYRMTVWSPDVILYVVDHRQQFHFEHLFKAARQWGYKDVDFQHIAFGTVTGKDGKPFRARSGETVDLEAVLDEAVNRARNVCPYSDERTAETIGIGALKYADLSHNRTSDYKFSYDKMLSLNGNTATYMQYAYARIKSIFRKGGIPIDRLRSSGIVEIEDLALTKELLRFPEVLCDVAEDYRPNLLTNYLFDLAKRFSEFFENCQVLKAENKATRDSRLLLCDITARTLQKGLELLGIDVVERM